MADVPRCPKMGPDPTLLSRKEIDALYETLDAIRSALDELKVDYIVTGGSLLGSIRQHSILFCDDDIDIAIIENANDHKNHSISDDNTNGKLSLSAYERVSQNLGRLLGKNYTYQIRPWEGGDKVRPKHFNNVFIDIFTLRRFEKIDDLIELIGMKKNGQPQSPEYVQSIVKDIEQCAYSQNERQLYGNEGASLYPFWHFNTRKAIEMWRKEVYRHNELFPLSTNLKFGPLENIKGPRMPVLLLKRAFGVDCFDVYYQSGAHTKGMSKVTSNNSAPNCNNGSKHKSENKANNKDDQEQKFSPLILNGGTWEGSKKMPLEDKHYVPIQPISRARRRPTLHNREQLFKYLKKQELQEKLWMSSSSNNFEIKISENRDQAKQENTSEETNKLQRPQRTVYMDGVFDLFHVGHVEAVSQCARLGNRVIIGITGDIDAADYKRPPIISEANRIAVVKAMKYVDEIVCPCPLIVTEEFMSKHNIDLVVHGFANDSDAKQQEIFFEIPMRLRKFQRIGYYDGLSTTDIIKKINTLPPEK